VPIPSPENCSGDMYGGVPATDTDEVTRSMARAMPKSTTRGPSEESSTLAGLKSRCTMPALWMATSAVAVPMASRSSAPGSSGPRAFTRRSSDSPSMYSLTTYGRSPKRPTSSTRAVQNAGTLRAASTSRSSRSRASSSAACRSCRILTATGPDSDSPR